MDYINKLSGSGNNDNTMNQTSENQQQTSSGSSGGGFMDKLNGLAGGGKESEKKEDVVDKGLLPGHTCLPNVLLTIRDKGVDWVQQNVFGQGPQDNESAIEQAKDEQISDYIRGTYKSTTGSDIPIQDK